MGRSKRRNKGNNGISTIKQRDNILNSMSYFLSHGSYILKITNKEGVVVSFLVKNFSNIVKVKDYNVLKNYKINNRNIFSHRNVMLEQGGKAIEVKFNF